MRVVADTNIVVSGLLWRGNPRRVLDAAREGAIDLFTSIILLTELEDVLSREKFAVRLAAVGVTPHDLVLGYAALASVIEPVTIEPVILADPTMMLFWLVLLQPKAKSSFPGIAIC